MNNRKEIVRDIDLHQVDEFSNLLESMGTSGGFNGRLVFDGYNILKKMFTDKKCINVLTFPASLIATGSRGIIKTMMKENLFDLVITTCGSIDHDIARTYANYYKGDFDLNDIELDKKGYHRLGNIIIPKTSYGELIEKKTQKILLKMYNSGIKNPSPSQIIQEIGKHINHENSILYWSEKNSIPIIVPGIMDGAVGNQIWLFNQLHPDFSINIIEDQQIIANNLFQAKKTGALIIGGGISKHHAIWWNQFKGGLDYAVYITTAVESDGSLSGARSHEAISWGKIAPNASHVTINSDATVVLPLLIKGLLTSL